jgi:hypothetical protein
MNRFLIYNLGITRIFVNGIYLINKLLAQVREDGESFFSLEFSAYVFLTDGTSFSFVRAIEGWTWCQYIDEESDGEEVGLG